MSGAISVYQVELLTYRVVLNNNFIPMSHEQVGEVESLVQAWAQELFDDGIVTEGYLQLYGHYPNQKVAEVAGYLTDAEEASSTEPDVASARSALAQVQKYRARLEQGDEGAIENFAARVEAVQCWVTEHS